MANETLRQAYQQLGVESLLYQRNKDRWEFLLESYTGGEVYRRGAHLTRYVLEQDGEYTARLRNTPLDNHCKSVISVYISFLFREGPDRDLGSLAGDPMVEDFLRDADLDGRSLNGVMKEAAIWSSVFGHSWILMTKPSVAAASRADQLAQGVRPYVNILTPMVVGDWTWERQANGRYELTYFKYIEDVNDSVSIVKEWTRDRIYTWQMDHKRQEAWTISEEVNELGKIPAVLVYNQRSQVRGLGLSDIDDIADQQRAIYNELSEVEQSVRLEGHPSLVTTPDVQTGSGAGAMIIMPENLDPGLKPYMLPVDPVPVDKLYESIRNRVDSIDRMANTGGVRATLTQAMSGVALETEFQMLNARLSEKADNLELAEEQMWRLWCEYEQQIWTGEIHYPDSFNIRDKRREYEELQLAKSSATSPAVAAVIDYKLMEMLDEEPEEIVDAVTAFMGIDADIQEVTNAVINSEMPDYPEHWMVNPVTGERREVESELVHNRLVAAGWVEA